MISVKGFTYGKNGTQEYYVLAIESSGELLQGVRNKGDDMWYGVYISYVKVQMCRIPVESSGSAEKLLKRICLWYNSGGVEKVTEGILEESRTDSSSPLKSKSLHNLVDAFGQFSSEDALLIQAYLDRPTVERWASIQNVVVNGHQTLREIMVVEEKSSIPLPIEILRVIKKS